ncbi:MAG: hypothetical protein ACM3ML_23605 [Micromonosporaceae bacterium]
MSTRRPYRVTRLSAERLLGGDPGDPQAGPESLARLLTAVGSVTVPDGEIPGEEAAVAAFRRAHLVPPAQPRRRQMLKTALANALTVKIAAAATAALAVGGVSYAVGTGSFTASFDGARHISHSATSHAKGGLSKIPSINKTATPIQALAGLCNAYLAGSLHAKGEGKAQGSAEFKGLIKAAGGTPEKAHAYCRALIRELRRPSGLPSGVPTTLPSGLPAILPTTLPTTLPSGVPTTLPSLPLPSPSTLPLPHSAGLPIPHPGR